MSTPERQLFSEAIKKHSEPAIWPCITYLTAMFVMLGIGCWLATAASPVPICGAVLLFGLVQYYAIVATHEAMHYGLHADKRINDLLGVAMALLTTFNYWELKAAHLAHHRLLGQPADPEYELYAKNSPADRFSILSSFSRPVAGLIASLRSASRPDAAGKPVHNARKGMGRILLFTSVVLTALMTISPWASAAWFAALVLIPGFLTHVRVILEHSGLNIRGEHLEDSKLGARTHIPPDRFIPKVIFDVFRVILSPFSFNYHHEHHIMPTIPYYNLWRVNRLLVQRGYYDDKRSNFSDSYWVTIRQNLRL